MKAAIIWVLAFGSPGAWQEQPGSYADSESCFKAALKKNRGNYAYPAFTCLRKEAK